MKIPDSNASRGERNRTSSPRTSTVPSSGRYSPVRTLHRVVLPAPFSPSSAWISPGRTSKVTRSLATTPGNCLLMLRAARAGTAEAGGPSEGGAAGSELTVPAPSSMRLRLARGAPDDALDEPVQRVLGQRVRILLIPHGKGLPGGQSHRSVLLRQPAGERSELPALDVGQLGRDGRLGLGADRLAERRELD